MELHTGYALHTSTDSHAKHFHIETVKLIEVDLISDTHFFEAFKTLSITEKNSVVGHSIDAFERKSSKIEYENFTRISFL